MNVRHPTEGNLHEFRLEGRIFRLRPLAHDGLCHCDRMPVNDDRLPARFGDLVRNLLRQAAKLVKRFGPALPVDSWVAFAEWPAGNSV